MKKNLILLGVFILLVGIGFVFEERRQVAEEHELRTKFFLLSGKMSSANKIVLPGLSLIKNDQNWVVEASFYPVEPKVIAGLTEDIEGIKFIEKLEVNEKEKLSFFQFQNHRILIEEDGEMLELILGDLNQVTGLFYLEFNEELYLVEIDAPAKFVYQDDIQKKKMKYIELKDLVTASEAGLIKKGLSHFVDFKVLVSVEFSPVMNRSFVVGKTGIIEPLPPKGISVFESVFKDIEELMNEITIQQIFSSEGLGESSAKVSFKNEGPEEVVLELYKNHQGETGYFLTINKVPNRVFQVDDSKLQLFFLGHQNFWNKKISFDENLSELRDIEFTIKDSSGKKSSKFKINSFEKFKITSLDKSKYEEKYLNLLFNIIFATTEFQQAREVGLISDLNLDPKDFFSVSLEILERDFKIYFFEKRIYLIDTKNEVFLRYEYDLGEFRPETFEDFVKGKR